MRIETDRLILRKFHEEDAADLHAYLSLEEIYQFEPGNPIDIKEAKDMAWERSRGDDFIAVVHKEQNTMIGHLYWSQAEPEKFMTWELGYIFNPIHQRKGYCTEACQAFLLDRFQDKDLHKVVAFCNPENTPSWRVLEKLGMTREAHFRQRAYFRKDDQGKPLWFDCYAYGILND